LAWVHRKVLQLIDDPCTYFVGLNGVLPILIEKYNIKVKATGWPTTCVTQRTALTRQVCNTGKRLLSGTLNPVLTEYCVWIVLKELDDNRIIVNLKTLSVWGVSMNNTVSSPPPTLNSADSKRLVVITVVVVYYCLKLWLNGLRTAYWRIVVIHDFIFVVVTSHGISFNLWASSERHAHETRPTYFASDC
jgi:hypothetical protein